MKKLYFLLIFSLFFSKVNAQWVTIPDANFVTFLQQNYPACMNGNQMDTTCSAIVNSTYLDCSNKNISDLNGIKYFDNLDTLICQNNQLTSLPVLPTSLSILDCSNNSLTSLTGLPTSLNHLLCNYNLLSFLPTLPNSLKSLYCIGNQLVSLPNLPSELKYLVCALNQLTSLPALPDSLRVLNCSINQLTNIPPLPSTFSELNCHSNQITTLPSIPKSVRYIDAWSNQLTFIPDLPDTLYSIYVHNNPNLSCLPPIQFLLGMSYYNTSIQCLSSYPSGLGGNTPIINPPISSIPLCDIFNPNNCNVFGDISGTVYSDLNINCTDNNEPKLWNTKLQLYKNSILVQQTYTNSQGLYFFYSDTGTFSYTVDTNNLPVKVTCPPSGFNTSILTPADSMDYNMDFAMQCKSGFDIGVKNIARTSGQFFPSNTATVKIGAGDMAAFYGLNCATGVSGIVTIDINGPVTYIAAAPGALTPVVLGNAILSYNISDFGTVNFHSDFRFIVQTDTLAQVGSIVCFTVIVTPASGDNDTTNNSLQHCFSVVNSFDPNDKQVFPSGDLLPDHEWLTYTIRFQNTGTAPAQHVYILDTLDTNLDVATFTLLSYSHDNLTQVLGDVVKFNFPHINLPDSTNDEPNSHGYIQYKIKLKPNLPIGTIISNTAYNFFDFNPPIATNTVVNQIYFLNPTITPNNLMLCPNESDTLWTQVYDSYQWFKDGNLIPGANDQFLFVDYFNNSGSQFMVEVDSAGVIAQSAPVLLDGWAFLPPFVISEGTFTVGPNGEMLICPGDTAHLILGSPYDTNILWTESGNIIPGANNDTLVVTQSGNYHVSGAPSTCPNYIQNLGVTVEVIVQGPPEPVINYGSLGLITQGGYPFYQWYQNGIPVGTNVNILPQTDPGMYTVVVTDTNGCTAESQVFIISSVIETSFSGIININYNSITGILHIIRSEATTETEIFVLDVLGRMIADDKMVKGKSELEIKISNIKPGIYFVDLSEGGSVKFFVE